MRIGKGTHFADLHQCPECENRGIHAHRVALSVQLGLNVCPTSRAKPIPGFPGKPENNHPPPRIVPPDCSEKPTFARFWCRSNRPTNGRKALSGARWRGPSLLNWATEESGACRGSTTSSLCQGSGGWTYGPIRKVPRLAVSSRKQRSHVVEAARKHRSPGHGKSRPDGRNTANRRFGPGPGECGRIFRTHPPGPEPDTKQTAGSRQAKNLRRNEVRRDCRTNRSALGYSIDPHAVGSGATLKSITK